jgi:hypothetical protein
MSPFGRHESAIGHFHQTLDARLGLLPVDDVDRGFLG